MKELQGTNSEKPPPISKSESQRKVVLNRSQKLLHFLKDYGKLPSTVSVYSRKAGASQELVGQSLCTQSHVHQAATACAEYWLLLFYFHSYLVLLIGKL